MSKRRKTFGARLLSGAAMLSMAAFSSAQAAQLAETADYSIPAQPLDLALRAFGTQSGHPMLIDMALIRSKKSAQLAVTADPETALRKLLQGTGLSFRRDGVVFAIIAASEPKPILRSPIVAAAETVSGSAVEGLVVTAQKRRENIQDVPIAISAFTQDQLTLSQIAGGPDLMTQVPNLTFTKTNFSGYSIQIRGIGTQAISATVDPAVAVAFNNTPFVRNRFFEQEFFDVDRIEVLRGPQGTLYGRNATAGVVNLISAKPSFIFESKGSLDLGSYNSRRLEGMLNVPLAEDKAALRFAGAWTKRDGYATNQITGNPIDGRDLWSSRLSLRLEPTETISANLIWEHFEENDDRLRSGKQLCKKHVVTEIAGVPMPLPSDEQAGYAGSKAATFSQGCTPVSMYSDEAFQTPNGHALPYYQPLGQLSLPVVGGLDPYLSTTQSRDLRAIESTWDPDYRARTDLAELQLALDITESLTLTSETAYSTDILWSLQDFNRFNTAHGAFRTDFQEDLGNRAGVMQGGVFCDPQLGCSDRLVAVDLSTAESRQFSQEFRLSSDYDGPFNFNLGVNFLRYDTEDKYYVFINTLSMWAATAYAHHSRMPTYQSGVSDNTECLKDQLPSDPNDYYSVANCIYIDPNPIGHLNDLGHNYFLSRNPYKLISYAVFGETYYQLTSDLKLTAGLRWTVDRKQAPRIPSWLLAANSFGYPISEVYEKEWTEPTGRLAIDWKPDLAFTDDTLFYASYAHGYKAGGSNPPPATIAVYSTETGAALREQSVTHPTEFDAEFVDAFEVGAKNTLFDGALTLNTSAFYYDYSGYQISQIVDRSAINMNFDADIWGAELEIDWRPLENFKLGFKGGYENTRMAEGSKAIDLMDRTAGDPNWVVVRPFPTVPSNCILPTWLVTWQGQIQVPHGTGGWSGPCVHAYALHQDPVTLLPYVPNPTEYGMDGSAGFEGTGYPGFDPSTAPNNGEGIAKDLSGNELPNAPHFTATLTADYSLPLPDEWVLTLHTDLYYQSEAWTRVFNMDGYDKLKAYTNVNFAAVLTNENAGWNIMAYVKNVADRDSITGAFLNSDDTGLTTNVFLTEPRVYGVRLTKLWSGSPISGNGVSREPGKPYPFTLEFSGAVLRQDAPNAVFAPDFTSAFSTVINPLGAQNQDMDWGDGRAFKITYKPVNDRWKTSFGTRFGKANGDNQFERQQIPVGGCAGPAEICEGRPKYIIAPPEYGKSHVVSKENYVIADFMVGTDVGFGVIGKDGASTIDAGVRYADFESKTSVDINGVTDWQVAPENAIYQFAQHREHLASLMSERSFEGEGPTLTWEASSRLLGNNEVGHLDMDWSITGGVLFGRQKTALQGMERSDYFDEKYISRTAFPENSVPVSSESATIDIHRTRTVVVPTFDASFGFSYSVDRVKIGFGYRWERYFNVIDGGVEAHESYDRTIDGPYFKVGVGFGG